MMGLPWREGSRISSTEAKKASKWMWTPNRWAMLDFVW